MESKEIEQSKKEASKDRLEERKEKIKNWLKNPYNLGLTALIIFTVGIRLYFFIKTANQPTWWDEGDYLALAKEFALPSAETPEWWGHFLSMRPLLLSIIWAFFIKLNIPESFMRLVTEVIPSVVLVIYSYLLASSMFNKKVGLMTGYLTSIYWVIIFYGNRFMTDIPAMMFAIISVYYFWEYYEKKGKSFGLYLCIIFGVLGFLTRFPTAFVTFSVIFYLLFLKKHRFFVDKSVWIAGIVGIVFLLPYFIFNKLMLGSWFPAASIYSTKSTITIDSPAWFLFSYIPELISWPLTIVLFVGLVCLIAEMILGFDLTWHQKDKSFNKNYLLAFWLLIQITYFVFVLKSGNDRWILLWMPPIFILISVGLERMLNIVRKYSKYTAIVLIVGILAFAGYSQLIHADQLTKIKLDTYKEVKDTGLWLRDNTSANAKIMGASIVQNSYYSHRRTYDFFTGTELQKQLQGELTPEGQRTATSYQVIFNETEFECKIVRIKPDYLVLHVWEPAFTPSYMFDYPQRHNETLIPVQAFYRDSKVTAAIYKFIDYPKIDAEEVNCTWVYDRPENITGIPLSLKEPFRLIIPS